MSELEALIAPSILASDFGQIAQECTRMVKGEGADWLHLGSPINIPLCRFVCLFACWQMSWMVISYQLSLLGIKSLASCEKLCLTRILTVI